MSRSRGFVTAAVLVFHVVVGSAQAGTPRVEVGPRPGWVQPIQADVAPDASRVDDGREYLLLDDQARITAADREHYRHVVTRVATQAGIQGASQIQIDFDPAYEHLTVNGVWVIRGGRRINAYRPREVRVVERETGLDEQMFDGTQTAVLFLSDVRVEDRIEYAFTLRGRNPVFGSHAQLGVWLQYQSPVARRFVRWVWPEAMPLSVQVRNTQAKPTIRHQGGFVEHVFDARDLAAIGNEDLVPDTVEILPSAQASDFPTWEEVSRWAATLYPHTRLSPEMARKVALWRKLPEEERFLAALQFTQDEIRYLGIELGASSHRPHPPSDVFARRFGDCKDKAYLLVELLRALGIDAVPALVNSRLRGGIAQLEPAPTDFDHVIVRAKVGGQARWVDATVTEQRGPLSERTPPSFGAALPVLPEGSPLETIPAPRPKEPRVDEVMTFDASRRNGPASLRVVTTYRGSSADAMRRRSSAQPIKEITRADLDFYARRFLGIRSLHDNEVTDDPARNLVTIVEDYEIPAFWKGGERFFDIDLVDDYLPHPRVTTRTLPLAVRDPVFVHTAVHVKLPWAIPITAEHAKANTAAGTLSYLIREDGQTLLLDYTYESSADSVPASRVARYLADLKTLRDDLGYTVTLPATPVEADSSAETVLGAFVLMGIVLGALFFRPRQWFRRGRSFARKRQFQRKFDVPEGTSPARAFRVAAIDLGRVHGRVPRCGCGARFTESAPRELEPLVLLGDQRITPVRVTCASCGQPQRIYFEVLGELRRAG